MQKIPKKNDPGLTDAYFKNLQNYTLANQERIVQNTKDNSYKMSIKTALVGGLLGLAWAFKSGSGPMGYFGYGLAGAFIGSALGGLVAVVSGNTEKV